MARNKYDIDEVMEDKFDFNQLKRVFQYVKPYRGQLAFALFLMLSASALTMLFPMFISEIMDTYIPAKDVRSIVAITLISLVIVLYTCVCIRLKIRITSRIGQAIVHQLRSDIFCHLQGLHIYIVHSCCPLAEQVIVLVITCSLPASHTVHTFNNARIR